MKDPIEQQVEFTELVSHLPVGICKILLDDNYTLSYGNTFFYDLMGYTREQVASELNSEIRRTFLPEERDVVSSAISPPTAGSTPFFHIEHRILRRNGTVIWVMVTGSYTTHNGIPAAYCVVVDITDRKHMEERLRIDEERFRLALAQTDSTIFDYDIANKVMIHADKSAVQYGLEHETHNVPDALVDRQVIHPDSTTEFLEMYSKIRAGAPAATCVVQVKVADGCHAWRRISMTNIFNREGAAVRAVGMLEDIDEQMRREESLRERSQRDSLTGLYHKGATEGCIRGLLQRESSSGVLYIIDIDLFKNVNDHYGHLFGDMVLAESAHRIAGLCRKGDIIGRIGGDEFLIYLDGAVTEKMAQKKAEEICACFESPFLQNGIMANVTCTVGLALVPEDGDSFETLYQKADVALYEAKRWGKNRYCRYQNGMGDSMEWTPYSSTAIDSATVPNDASRQS